MCSSADWQRRRRRETQHSELATMRRRLAITQRWGTTPKSTFWNSAKSTFWNSYNCRPWPSTRPTGPYQPNCSSTEPQPIQSKIHSFVHPLPVSFQFLHGNRKMGLLLHGKHISNFLVSTCIKHPPRPELHHPKQLLKWQNGVWKASRCPGCVSFIFFNWAHLMKQTLWQIRTSKSQSKQVGIVTSQ